MKVGDLVNLRRDWLELTAGSIGVVTRVHESQLGTSLCWATMISTQRIHKLNMSNLEVINESR